MIDCESEELWKRYIAAHPDARGIKGKQIDMYEELQVVCGNYQVPSSWAKTRDGHYHTRSFEEDSASFVSPSTEDASDTDGTNSYTVPEEEEEEFMQDGRHQEPFLPPRPPIIQPVKQQLPKRPSSREALQEAMLAIASSIRRLADAVEQSKTPLDSSELLKAVMEIDGLEEGKQMYAFEYLNADPIKARAFMTYNVRMRKVFLFRQFWWWR
ncbi:unnamed protein product [Linum tenue]|uniref:Uncharacterized protein n=1 Tax=Linum tenue TaxID=586396 RepID=A0AAV0KGL3_9ROSI|nr:unnamed protein product [Linum tenue]